MSALHIGKQSMPVCRCRVIERSPAQPLPCGPLQPPQPLLQPPTPFATALFPRKSQPVLPHTSSDPKSPFVPVFLMSLNKQFFLLCCPSLSLQVWH